MLDFIRKKDYWDAMNRDLLSEIPGKLSFQLKTVQDLWVYSVLRNETDKKIAEIGGGDSRILRRLSKTNTCFNIDKFEGADQGPENEIEIPNVENIKCFVGNSTDLIKDASFDILFSVSVVEHVADQDFPAFFKDCIRILKPGGYMVHAIDMYISDEPTPFWKNRYDMYRNSVENSTDVIPVGEVRSSGLKFSPSFASNTDEIMYKWKNISPSLDSLRQEAQNVSVKMIARKWT